MKRSHLLLIDSLINVLLGIVLLLFPKPAVEALGLPPIETAFYPNILGAVLIGIGIALLIEWRRKPARPAGLGLGGAVAINLCGGIVLAGWLLVGGLDIPLRGQILFWGLVAVLAGISAIEIVAAGGRPPDE